MYRHKFVLKILEWEGFAHGSVLEDNAIWSHHIS